MTMTRTVHCYA